MSKTTKISLLVVAVVILSLGLLVGNFILEHKRNQPQMFADPVFDFVPPVLDLAQRDFSVLVFSKTNGFRHHEAIPAAKQLLAAIAEQQQWAIAFTENGAVFNAEQLARFDVVVWNNATGPALTLDQQRAFENFIVGGGGYVGIHAAGDGSHKSWDWYANEVIRSQFTMHPMWPQIQQGNLHTEAIQHPIIRELPAQWVLQDEWYSFESSVRTAGSQVLLTIDEKSYDPNFWAMGDDHPLVWAHDVGAGRAVYSAPGHLESVYQDKRYQSLITEAIGWAGQKP
ncbi:ThuA domain-containing protein [Oceanicoccus sp. KOV_DT_Chl]|uniref:ThuA domain-containing protein n=1 Tax=Oceanicoccus sp. KOV_DT_Chl TaxID=1904639 RepID=UPI000C7CCE2A|nr:ThuA domain-containing protein [Oceanicoccus sp. KOV_DT_Chl]